MEPGKTNGNAAEDLADSLRELVQTEAEIIRLRAIDKVSGIGAKITAGALITFVLALLGVSLYAATAFWLSGKLGSYTRGFLAVSGICFVVFLFLFAFRRPILYNPMRNMLTRKLSGEGFN